MMIDTNNACMTVQRARGVLLEEEDVARMSMDHEIDTAHGKLAVAKAWWVTWSIWGLVIWWVSVR